MTYALMIYVLVVSVLLAGGAALAQSLVRSSIPGIRFIWAAAMGGSLLLLAVAPARLRAPAAPVLDATAATATNGAAVPADLPMSFAARTGGAMPSWLSAALGVLWVASSLLVLALLALSYRRHRRGIAGAARETLDGTAVRVTESLGPTVVGVWRPDIVVPRWLLARPSAEQSLVVRHERSHVEVGDPALLLAGCATAALMPWNPATWYMLGRLRLAIEVDCDRRVLRAGAPPREYGALLIELTSAMPAARIGAPAFACRPSHLERRIVAMTARPLTNRPVRMLAAAGVAALALLGACEADLPTAAEVEKMDAAEVEERLMPTLKLDASSITYQIDGKTVDRATVMALAPEQIGSVEVTRTGVPRMVVTTRGAMDARDGDARDRTTRELAAVEARRALTIAERQLMERRASRPLAVQPSLDGSIMVEMGDSGVVSLPRMKPLLILDGVIVDEIELRKLTSSSIETVEIKKGDDARRQYGDKGANGVVEVTTLKASAAKRQVEAKKP